MWTISKACLWILFLRHLLILSSVFSWHIHHLVFNLLVWFHVTYVPFIAIFPLLTLKLLQRIFLSFMDMVQNWENYKGHRLPCLSAPSGPFTHLQVLKALLREGLVPDLYVHLPLPQPSSLSRGGVSVWFEPETSRWDCLLCQKRNGKLVSLTFPNFSKEWYLFSGQRKLETSDDWRNKRTNVWHLQWCLIHDRNITLKCSGGCYKVPVSCVTYLGQVCRVWGRGTRQHFTSRGVNRAGTPRLSPQGAVASSYPWTRDTHF